MPTTERLPSIAYVTELLAAQLPSTAGRTLLLPTKMSEIEDSLVRFESYGAIERLEAALKNPDDHALLYSLTRQNENHKQPGLSIIWAFAMTKVGAMKQTCDIGTPWQGHHVQDHPDGFFPVLAYLQLASRLRNQADGTVLHDLLEENVRMKCPEAPLWAMWEFAMHKGRESSRQWRRELDAARQLETAEEKATVCKGLREKLNGCTKALCRRRVVARKSTGG